MSPPELSEGLVGAQTDRKLILDCPYWKEGSNVNHLMCKVTAVWQTDLTITKDSNSLTRMTFSISTSAMNSSGVAPIYHLMNSA